MAERIVFRGMTAAEAEKLSLEQYTKLVNARERRAIKRSALRYRRLVSEIGKSASSWSKTQIKTHVRDAVILPSWIGKSIAVYNGKEFQPVEITAAMLGHRLGEFAFSTKRVLHSAPGIRATRGSKFLAVK